MDILDETGSFFTLVIFAMDGSYGNWSPPGENVV